VRGWSHDEGPDIRRKYVSGPPGWCSNIRASTIARGPRSAHRHQVRYDPRDATWARAVLYGKQEPASGALLEPKSLALAETFMTACEWTG
jgi:hypothetical protein